MKEPHPQSQFQSPRLNLLLSAVMILPQTSRFQLQQKQQVLSRPLALAYLPSMEPHYDMRSPSRLRLRALSITGASTPSLVPLSSINVDDSDSDRMSMLDTDASIPSAAILFGRLKKLHPWDTQFDEKDRGTPDQWIPRHKDMIRLTGRHVLMH